MQVYWLTDRTTGETTLVDADTVERLLGVELGYVEWCIKVGGLFENGKWRVYLAVENARKYKEGKLGVTSLGRAT